MSSPARYMGWEGASNGDLITAVEEHGFDVLITADQNLQQQQNMSAGRTAIVVLETNHWATISRDPARFVDAVNRCTPGPSQSWALTGRRRERRAGSQSSIRRPAISSWRCPAIWARSRHPFVMVDGGSSSRISKPGPCAD